MSLTQIEMKHLFEIPVHIQHLTIAVISNKTI